jgi:glycosyltransferase involved in cell wall biosynthesis
VTFHGAPLITTIVPTYRRPAMLRRAIKSALRQTFPALQICVYDNAGDPDNATVVAAFKDPRIHYERHETDLGSFANFQFGLSRVATPFFSVLADDDVLLPEFYETAMQALREQPAAMFAATRVVLVDGAGRTLSVDGTGWTPGLYQPPDGLTAMAERGHINWTGILFRRAALEVVPLLDPDTAPSFDLDFELRLASRCAFVVTDRPGALLVHHLDSRSGAGRVSDTWPSFLKIIANATGNSLTPEPARRRVTAILDRELGGRLFRLGRAAARRGAVEEADRAATLIAQRYGWRGRAQAIRVLARICRVMPPTRPILQLALDAYRVGQSRRLGAGLGRDYGRWVRE